MAQATVGEKYLGGFTSPSIRSGRLDIRPCGVYVTDKRIFLVRSPISWQLGFTALWSVALILLLLDLVLYGLPFFIYGKTFSYVAYASLFWPGLVLLFIFLGLAWYRNYSKLPIERLEKIKVWEIQRDQIVSIDMTKGTLSYSRIKIHLKSGETRLILFSETGSLDRAKRLLSM
jgi:hypothetical protein